MLDDHSEIFAGLRRDLEALDAYKTTWAKTPIETRIAVLTQVKDRLADVAEGWVDLANRKKNLAPGSHFRGEEWLTAIYPIMAYCNGLIKTLGDILENRHLDNLTISDLPNGQISVAVNPTTILERLASYGTKVDVWMQPGISRKTLRENTATAYAIPPKDRVGKVALVLGAGNIASIAPLDCFQKLFCENQVCILKLNPINEYLYDHMAAALRPLISLGALKIVKGGLEVAKFLTMHPLVEEIHITGSQSSFDAIYWGPGKEGVENKANNTPINTRPIHCELGNVSATIVVPGNWSDKDYSYHGQHLATQKLVNSGFNCVTTQMLILPQDWAGNERLLKAMQSTIAKAPGRPAYYPGTEKRLAEYCDMAGSIEHIPRKSGPACAIVTLDGTNDPYYENTEIFGPGLSIRYLAVDGPEKYLQAAVDYANNNLHGTLSISLAIHPKTIAEIGRVRFDQIISELRYGAIAINNWGGFTYTVMQATWGAFPGHSPQDIQSGIGVVHNSNLFDKPQRTVIESPFRMRPLPLWFITNKAQGRSAEHFAMLYYRVSFRRLVKLVTSLFGRP